MEALQDLSWLRDLRLGRVVERFDYGPFRVVAVSIPSTESHALTQFHYRLLFFPVRGTKPVFALNLESSILGSYCLTEQTGSRHVSIGHAEEDMSYQEFRLWALEQADRELARA